MFKTALSLALVGLISAQSVESIQPLANEALAAAENVNVAHNGDSASLGYGQYEWSVTEHNHEYSLAASEAAASVAPSLSALLSNVGNVVQENAGDLQSESALAVAAGEQLQNNAESLAEAAQSNYPQAVEAAQANSEAITNLVNSEAANVNNAAESVSSADVAEAVQVAQANSESITNLVNSEAANANNAAENVNAGNVAQAVQAVQAANPSAGQAAEVANNAISQDAAANGVSNGAAEAAQNGVNAGASSLGANGL